MFSLVSKKSRTISFLLSFCGMIIFVFAGWGCHPQKKTEIRPPAGLLMPRVRDFNKSMRWRRYSEAKTYVEPDNQAEWMMERERTRGMDNIAEYALRDIVFREEGREAWVIVVYQRFQLPSTVVQRQVRAQRWKYVKNNWYFSEEKEKIPKKKEKTTKVSATKQPLGTK
ncbi:MAG: hypothetical protein H6728_04265 [Myxococcales bacterium]|nr:hypothetical protein [Myxococcales bacterium]MCB9642266.1 hypothetical protein [Myxococcales bacterium]